MGDAPKFHRVLEELWAHYRIILSKELNGIYQLSMARPGNRSLNLSSLELDSLLSAAYCWSGKDLGDDRGASQVRVPDKFAFPYFRILLDPEYRFIELYLDPFQKEPSRLVNFASLMNALAPWWYLKEEHTYLQMMDENLPLAKAIIADHQAREFMLQLERLAEGLKIPPKVVPTLSGDRWTFVLIGAPRDFEERLQYGDRVRFILKDPV